MTGDVKLKHETPAEFLGRLGRVGRLQQALGRVRICINFLREREGAEEVALLADAEALAGRLSEALEREMGRGHTSVGVEPSPPRWCKLHGADCKAVQNGRRCSGMSVDISTEGA